MLAGRIAVVLSLTPLLGQRPASLAREAAVAGLTNLPLQFEINAGQAPGSSGFIAHGRDYSLALRSGAEAVLELGGGRAGNTARKRATVHMRLLGARASQAQGLDPLETRSNYFVGPDPAKWLVGIRNYGRVTYSGVYPGIALSYYGTTAGLEFDFIVDADADPRAIVLAFEGTESVHIDDKGDLVITTSAGEIRQHRATIYQRDGARTSLVEGGYRLLGQNRVGFVLGNYDRRRALVLDPVLSYSTYFGGTGWDEGVGFAIDAAHNTYVAGWTTSSNLPATGPQIKSGGGPTYGDAFVFKMNSMGTRLIYCTYLGGEGDDRAWALALDPTGAAYVIGATTSKDFPVTTGAYQKQRPGDGAAFITKLDPSGGKLVYSTYLGGNGVTNGLGISVDNTGSSYVTGGTTSTDFPVTPGAYQTSSLGKSDVFVAKLDPAGASLLYSTLIGGSGVDSANGIAIDSAGFAYLTGYTQSADFPTTPGAYSRKFYGGLGDCFVTKLNPGGSALVYSMLLGTPSEDFGRAIAVDSGGNAYIGGRTGAATFPVTRGAFQTKFGGDNDGFVTKVNASGSALLYSTFLGGAGSDQIEGLAIDSMGAAHIVGLSESKNFPVTSDALQPSLRGAQNGTVTKLRPDGSAMIFSTYLGGSGGVDLGIGVTADAAGSTYVMGYTNSDDFFITPGAFKPSLGGGKGRVFVTRIDYSANCAYRLSSTSQSLPASGGLAQAKVITGDGCPWTATSGVPWITGQMDTGVGAAPASLDVASNPGSARSSTVTIAGKSFTVRQAGRAAR